MSVKKKIARNFFLRRFIKLLEKLARIKLFERESFEYVSPLYERIKVILKASEARIYSRNFNDVSGYVDTHSIAFTFSFFRQCRRLQYCIRR